jgi:hypothetical protein
MITDDKGNKIPQPRVGKREFAKNVRSARVGLISDLSKTDAGKEKINKNICDECGFRIRSEGHLEGPHHNSRVSLHRKR